MIVVHVKEDESIQVEDSSFVGGVSLYCAAEEYVAWNLLSRGGKVNQDPVQRGAWHL